MIWKSRRTSWSRRSLWPNKIVNAVAVGSTGLAFACGAAGASADVVVYDYENLEMGPIETVHDFPGGEWRRVQKAKGYKHVIVNGEITMTDGEQTGATSGRLLRYGA